MKRLFLIDAIIQHIRSGISQATESKRSAQSEANEHKGAMESRHDTFKEEAQYMVSAQEVRISELSRSLETMQDLRYHADECSPGGEITLGSIVRLSSLSNALGDWYILSPAAGGLDIISDDGVEVTAITSESPLGSMLLGRSAGDEIELPLNQGRAVYTVTEVI